MVTCFSKPLLGRGAVLRPLQPTLFCGFRVSGLGFIGSRVQGLGFRGLGYLTSCLLSSIYNLKRRPEQGVAYEGLARVL